MNPRQMLDAALQLSPEERAALAGELIQSLDTKSMRMLKRPGQPKSMRGSPV
jgi:hypothetical protein